MKPTFQRCLTQLGSLVCALANLGDIARVWFLGILKMKTALGLASMLLLFAPSLAFAELCDNPSTQSDMTYCADWQFKKDDAGLNEVYGRLKESYAKIPAAKTALTKAQRAWVTFRDAECILEAVGEEGGTAQPMVYSQCLSRLTQLRIEQLQKRLDCQEGDLTCIAAGDAAD
jgi:uncharacterized protein YecT (DUF1311 family)